MNWQEIKEKYPNTSKEAIEYYELSKLPKSMDSILGMYIEDESLRRILYDFFDEQDVYITIANEKKGLWRYGVESPNDILSVGGSYKTRTEAEEQAFLKAFGILEQRLK